MFSHFDLLSQQLFILGSERQFLLVFGFELIENLLVSEVDAVIVVAGVFDIDVETERRGMCSATLRRNAQESLSADDLR